ncbi:hypothetical protein EW146_g44 [Bondarzewia mesenterica]|uniref:Uncharacterized protein n=1 Tax=Bondarzewia mesenterica TaxID=1095465 RepID=A0A4S4MAK3_9AGAM|nr:hypothetical protein EW146_g44 [Bondarzewia mesenterica]
MKTLPIPLEILSKIFILCVYGEGRDYATVHPNEAPLLFTRVCREWRTVALSLPQLWEILDLKLDLPKDSTRFRSLVSTVQNWLANRKSLPVSVIVSIQDTRADRVEELLTVVCNHSRQWRYFNIVLHPSVVVPSALSGSADSLPLLATCIIRGNMTMNNSHVLLRALRSAPRLRSLTMEWVDSLQDWILPSPLLEYFSLDLGDLHQDPCSLHQVFPGISQCRNLATLVFSGPSDPDTHMVSLSPHVELPQLNDLELHVATQEHLEIFLRSFSLPRLEYTYTEVNVQHMGLQDISLPATLLASASYFSSSLHTLNLNFIRFSDITLVQILQNLPNLVSVGLFLMVFNTHAIDALTHRFSSEGILVSGQNTKLSDVHLCFDDFTHLLPPYEPFGATFYNRLVNMVESRWRLPINAVDTNGNDIVRLRLFDLDDSDMRFMEEEGPEAFSKFRGFLDEGLIHRDFA